MPEASQITFTFSEIAEALVKTQDIHEGHWGLWVKFAIAAVNAAGPSGELAPTAIIPIQEIGIQKFPEPNSLTVDASKANPRPSLGPKKGKALIKKGKALIKKA